MRLKLNINLETDLSDVLLDKVAEVVVFIVLGLQCVRVVAEDPNVKQAALYKDILAEIEKSDPNEAVLFIFVI